MIADWLRNAYASRSAFCLKSGCYVHGVAVQVSPIGNHIPDIDPDAEADGSIRGLIAIVDRRLLLVLYGTTYRSVYAVEHDEQRIAPRIDEPATMLLDCRINHVPAECP
jgi:hypothetical protein